MVNLSTHSLQGAAYYKLCQLMVGVLRLNDIDLGWNGKLISGPIAWSNTRYLGLGWLGVTLCWLGVI